MFFTNTRKKIYFWSDMKINSQNEYWVFCDVSSHHFRVSVGQSTFWDHRWGKNCNLTFQCLQARCHSCLKIMHHAPCTFICLPKGLWEWVWPTTAWYCYYIHVSSPVSVRDRQLYLQLTVNNLFFCCCAYYSTVEWNQHINGANSASQTCNGHY